MSMRFSTLAKWLAWQETLHPNAIDLGLDRVRVVQERLGLARPAFVVMAIGGTNGKGSTVAMLEAILRAAGFRVGAYTSPHLLQYNERIRVNGICASDAQLCAAFERIDQARRDISLTYFEFGTLAAMEIFARAGLDVAILEVGMGGRLDAVNVWDADVAVVTTVDIDHVEWLGPDREAIAFEKAGIFRSGRAAIYGDRDVPQSLRRHAMEIGARLRCFDVDYGFRMRDSGWDWWSAAKQRSALPLPALRGAHQLHNAAAALMALECIATRLPVSQADIRVGLSNATVPGRFQVIPGVVTRIFDVAHNAQGTRALAQTLSLHTCAGRTLAVFGMLRDKDIAAALRELRGQIDVWYVAPVMSARSASATELLEAVQTTNPGAAAHAFADVASAIAAANVEARGGDRIIVFGSFYTVAAALASAL